MSDAIIEIPLEELNQWIKRAVIAETKLNNIRDYARGALLGTWRQTVYDMAKP